MEKEEVREGGREEDKDTERCVFPYQGHASLDFIFLFFVFIVTSAHCLDLLIQFQLKMMLPFLPKR